MSVSDGGSSSARCPGEISEEQSVRPSVDLVAAARRNLCFLRHVAGSHWLRQRPAIVEAIRRYDELWMPLLSDFSKGSVPEMILPPLDIEWVWFCHTLNPANYRQYCESRFSKLIGKPAIFNKENEDYALDRCREIWTARYPWEPFENEPDSNIENPFLVKDMLVEIEKQECLCDLFLEPYVEEVVYLIAAKKRYISLLYLMQQYAGSCSVFVPTLDILLMWLTHKSYPTMYASEAKEIQDMRKLGHPWDPAEGKELDDTRKLWEKVFDQPYEKAGCAEIQVGVKFKPPIHWEVTKNDVNAKYKSLLPRFLLKVNITVKVNSKVKALKGDILKEFLRFRVVRCHRDLKINKPLPSFNFDSWDKALHMYCEFGTKGVQVEVRDRSGLSLRGSKLHDSQTFFWTDLLRAPSLAIDKEVDRRVRVGTSITPPAQASYLLKCVPDLPTDDSGAMISDVILRMNQHRPQEGRWLSRTVLDHAGRECFVLRMRVGAGIWRRGGENPSAVKWEDRIVEVREGCWSYVAGSVGKAPVQRKW